MNGQLPDRQTIRLQGYDYSNEGLYFVTICCQDRRCLFGNIHDGEMILNDAGQIADYTWNDLPGRFPQIILHEYIIMPNHMHGIIEISPVGVTLAVTRENEPLAVTRDIERAEVNPAPTIGDIIGAYKSLTTNACLQLYKAKNEIMGKLWQRNYYEHIIRNGESYEKISAYIHDNPARWADDEYFTE